MLNDPLADVMSDINIFENARKKECTVPASKLVGNVLHTMQKNNYIGAFEYIDDGKSGKFKIELLGRINTCGVIKPRYASGKDEYEKWEKRFLPAKGFGIMVVSTPKGIMNHKEASERGLGGRLLGFVY
jgi:small subunit ribosomal protein S8